MKRMLISPSLWHCWPIAYRLRVSIVARPLMYLKTMSSLAPVQPPVSTILPSDTFQLLSTQGKAGASEDELYEQQIRDVKEWWQSPRYIGVRRPYSPEDVVSKRGSLQQNYPSSIMARKLFNLLNERAAVGQPVHTSKRIVFSPRSRGNWSSSVRSGGD